MLINMAVLFAILTVMKSYRYVLLDWDGNLARTLHLWLAITRDIFQQHGYELSDKEIVSKFGGFVANMTASGIPEAEATEMYSQAVEAVKSKLPEIELYPDAVLVVEQLRARDKSIALVTSSVAEHVTPALEKYGFDSLFDAVISADNVVNHKPDPEPVEKALEALGGNIEEAIIVGDSRSDILAGRNAGIDSVLFYPPEHELFYERNELEKYQPTYVIDNFKMLLDIIH